MLNIYYMSRFVPDGTKRKMPDKMPNMNSSSQEGPREKNLKTNVTVPHKLKLHRCPKDDTRDQNDNTYLQIVKGEGGIQSEGIACAKDRTREIARHSYKGVSSFPWLEPWKKRRNEQMR